MRTASERKARDLKEHRKSWKLQLHIWLEPGLLEISSFLAGGHGYPHSPPLGISESYMVASIPAGLFKSWAGLKNPRFIFWLPQGFILHGPQIPRCLENQDCLKNPLKVMLWNPQTDVLFCLKQKTKKQKTDGGWAFASFEGAAQQFGFSSTLGGVDAHSSCVTCSALGAASLCLKDNFCSLSMATRHAAFFQCKNHFNLAGWQLSGFGHATTPHFHMF